MWVRQMLTDDHKAVWVTICQAILTHNGGMSGTLFSLFVTMDET